MPKGGQLAQTQIVAGVPPIRHPKVLLPTLLTLLYSEVVPLLSLKSPLFECELNVCRRVRTFPRFLSLLLLLRNNGMIIDY